VAMIFRLVRSSPPTIEELGLPQVVGRLAAEPRGLVLVTGPTGSGKTTTLAAMIDHINRSREVHIVTIEDPIEVLHADKCSLVNQREIGSDTEDYGTALRRVCRRSRGQRDLHGKVVPGRPHPLLPASSRRAWWR